MRSLAQTKFSAAMQHQKFGNHTGASGLFGCFAALQVEAAPLSYNFLADQKGRS